MTDQAGTGDAPAAGEEGATGSPPDIAAENAALKEENARLREERRVDRAKALGAEFGLTPTQAELIALLPADQQEAKAKALAAEAKGGTAPATPPPDPDPSTTPQPDDPALAGMSGGGETPPAADPAAGNDLNAQIAAAAEKGDWDAIQQIQQAAQRAASEEAPAPQA